jgi:hypothetical protein
MLQPQARMAAEAHISCLGAFESLNQQLGSTARHLTIAYLPLAFQAITQHTLAVLTSRKSQLLART